MQNWFSRPGCLLCWAFFRICKTWDIFRELKNNSYSSYLAGLALEKAQFAYDMIANEHGVKCGYLCTLSSSARWATSSRLWRQRLAPFRPSILLIPALLVLWATCRSLRKDPGLPFFFQRSCCFPGRRIWNILSKSRPRCLIALERICSKWVKISWRVKKNWQISPLRPE